MVPACQNAADSVTVSGPSEAVAAFVTQLQAEEVFVRTVNSSGVAFHSRYVAGAAPRLREALEKVRGIRGDVQRKRIGWVGV